MNDIEEIIAQGEQAQKLMKNPAYENAIVAIRNEATSLFMNSTPTDKDKREAAYFTLQAIDKLDQRLRNMVFNGEIEVEKAKRRGRPPKV